MTTQRWPRFQADGRQNLKESKGKWRKSICIGFVQPLYVYRTTTHRTDPPHKGRWALEGVAMTTQQWPRSQADGRRNIKEKAKETVKRSLAEPLHIGQTLFIRVDEHGSWFYCCHRFAKPVFCYMITQYNKSYGILSDSIEGSNTFNKHILQLIYSKAIYWNSYRI